MDNKTRIPSKLVAIKLISIALSNVGCGMAVQNGDGLTLSGSPEGIQAFSDMLAGVATNSKASQDAPDTPYYQLRRYQGLQVKLPRVKQQQEK